MDSKIWLTEYNKAVASYFILNVS